MTVITLKGRLCTVHNVYIRCNAAFPVGSGYDVLV